MSNYGFPSRPSLYSRTLRECRELFLSSSDLIAESHPALLEQRSTTASDFRQRMDDLHRGLVLKVYLLVVEADRQWSKQERFYGEVLCHHLFGKWLSHDELKATIKRASVESASLRWHGLLGPFEQMEPLRSRVAELETIVSRLANLVGRCDGALDERERAMLRTIEEEIAAVLKPLSLSEAIGDSDSPKAAPDPPPRSTSEQAQAEPGIYEDKPPILPTPAGRLPESKSREGGEAAERPSLDTALDELDQLIGLESIKGEVRSLANFLRLQQRREDAGLPETDISLHMVFTGNPGTGKTTVARIVGKVFNALGVLKQGHLVETDRSGLVAEYAGQTGPKTNKKIDEALGGLLFVDEAYSLVARESEDPYGREAVQALLKRAEDDRHRLVVTLAGYPDEMDTLLRSNPGLSSRFNRRLAFDDYTPLELCRIFGLMCRKNHYRLAPAARLKVMLGMQALYGRRDRHFGNGRASRNLFEHAVRQMANRLADLAEATQEQLMTLEASDIEFLTLEAAVFESLDESQVQVRLTCPGCEHTNDVPTEFLGKSVKCPKCAQQFTAEWGQLAAPA